jgi:hypothetical protein
MRVGQLVFSGTCAVICNTNSSFYPVDADSITIADASLFFLTNQNRLFAKTPFLAGSMNLTILYRNATQQPEQLPVSQATFWQIGNLMIPENESWRFCISRSGFQRCFESPDINIKGIVASVPDFDNYSISATSADIARRLITLDNMSVFDVSSNLSFFKGAVFYLPVRTHTASATQSHAFAPSGTVLSVCDNRIPDIGNEQRRRPPPRVH